MSQNPKTPGIDINSAMMKDLAIHQNIKQELVVTTVDKLKLCLIEHRDHLRAGAEWAAMLGLTLSLVTTLATSNFKDSFSLKADEWHAVYTLAALGSAIWSVILVVRAIRTAVSGGIDRLIDRIASRNQMEFLFGPDLETRHSYFRDIARHGVEPSDDGDSKG